VTRAEDLATRDYSRPTRSCDIVMKGGITSGVVYPHAVCDLAETYRFRNVGGTSAGAIAAAATAAAEYGRGKGGFSKLAGLPAWIGAGKNLQNLFQPQRSTRRLYSVLIAKVESGWAKAAWTALWRHWPAAIAGALPGLALAAFVLAGDHQGASDALVWATAVAGGLLALIGLVLGVAAHLARQVTHAVPDNKFGICSGGPGSSRGGAKPLAPWLTDLLNDTAGLPAEEPLTFGHLRAGPEKSRTEQPGEFEEPHLELAMMTTNLVNRRAHQLPWVSREWFFNPDEFRQLFPPEVVDWMLAHPQQSPPVGSAEAQDSRMRRALFPELSPMPAPEDLPVVVATRMSLSFPVLLSAVPLWNIDMTDPENAVLGDWYRWARSNGVNWDPLESDISRWPKRGQPETRPEAEPCWFSDGGISSNFPVHFFDHLVPRWPTFAINLRPFPLGRERDDDDQAENIEMAKANSDGIREWWYRLPQRPKGLGLWDTRLFSFLLSAVRTMQNRADEAQMRAPGYRDRVAHVNMSEDEGGMNLTMPRERIEALTERGQIAAERLRLAYTPPDEDGQKITWDNHRWVRLRSSLGVLEQLHERFADGYSKPVENVGERTYADLLDPDKLPPSYKWKSGEQARLARDEANAILVAASLSNREQGITVLKKAPKPTPEGRIIPKD
jgi:predicted acylesterase/phospholipase RssA